ncbi:DUF2442 domain-containing protein [bacterium]|nr:MAG: DUF2442 domain-containing protein [bacterium]
MAGRAHAITDADIEAAYRRGEEAIAREPFATSVRYDSATDTVVIAMNNGAALVIPRRLLQGLRDASLAQLERGRVVVQGTALTWPDLDVDFTLGALLNGIYGGRRWMSELARHAGATKSKAKAAAARANGLRGGRPRKSRP